MARFRHYIVVACLTLLQTQLVLASASACRSDMATDPALKPAMPMEHMMISDEPTEMGIMPGMEVIPDTVAPCHGDSHGEASLVPVATGDHTCVKCELGCGGFASFVAPAAAATAPLFARASTSKAADDSLLSGSPFPALRPPIP
ncbi:MAG: hypothetical protein AAFY29_16385 [Pseudomonadota bacterium]